MVNMSQFSESTTYIIFVVWIFIIKAIFSCLNLKPDDECLPYSVPNIFNKNRHDFTDFIIV